MRKLVFLTVFMFIQADELTNNTEIDITKSWSQEPLGWTYPIYIHVPEINVPDNGLTVCILLHGNGGNGNGMLSQWINPFNDYILIAPTGYLNSWNISDENSEAPDVDMIDDLVHMLQTYENVNPNRIRILGFSNGAALANRVFIENTNVGIDVICSVVSQLSEAQYHNENFYYPGGATGGNQEFDGYDIITFPITGRKYLNIGNVNDQLIPYYGGESVGVNFLDSQEAIYIIANSQGYLGDQLSDEGEEIGSSSVFEYAYQNKQVVHLRGNAGHGINLIQREYIVDFFNVILGDLNDDLLVNILDVVILVNIVLGISDQIPGSDINQDGDINILDVVQMVGIIID